MAKNVDFNNYQRLPSEKKELIKTWFEQAWNYRNSHNSECFLGFMSAWIAFNSWAASITQEDGDAEMIKLLCKDKTLEKDFNILRNNHQFRNRLEIFYEELPIVSVKKKKEFTRALGKFKKEPNLKKTEENVLNSWGVTKLELESSTYDYDIDIIFSKQFNQIRNEPNFPLSNLKKIKDLFAPECWTRYRGKFQEIERNWRNTLQSLYRVRCNLFHGEKSPILEDDRRIVISAFQVMIYIFCYIFYKHNVIDSRDYDIVQLLEINSSSSSFVEEESEDFKF
jgi:hypothetical protein